MLEFSTHLLQVSHSKIEEEMTNVKLMLSKAQQHSDETKKGTPVG